MPAVNPLFKKITPKRPLYVQIIFTVFSYLIMVVLSYVFTKNIVDNYLKQNTNNIFVSLQSQIMTDLLEPQITLESFSRTMREMIINGDDADRLREYFNDMSNYLSLDKQSYLNFNGFMGYFETIPGGPVFIESLQWNRPDDYVITKRKWYQDAIAADGRIAETLMYHDMVYEDIMLIYSRCIFDDHGQRLGVVALRVKIDNIRKYIVNTAMVQGSYGMLISGDLIVLAHPNGTFVGENIYNLEIPFSIFVNDLNNGSEIIERPMTTYEGERALASFRFLPNGWIMGIITPKGPYYKSISNMALILVILGTALSSVLIFVLIRVDAARNKSDLENKHKTSFLANVSHEIRTPMNAIIGMTDLLNYEPLNKRQTGFVNDIKIASHSLLSIINDILDMSKIEAGKLELNPINYDFHLLLDNVHSMFSYVTKKRGIEFKYETEGTMPRYLYGDDIRLKQVLTNICGNAVKYTEKGYVKFKVTAADDKLIFEIKDTGIGMRKEDLPKLFNTFQRIETEQNRSIVGTGLGLSISKTFVEMMGGSIMVDSEYEQGSVFRIIIPVVLGKKEDVKSNKGLPEGHTLFAPDAKVLIVDDNELNIKVAEGLLGLFMINVHKAYSGRKAIDMVQKDDYDIVFMDHMMPEMDGVEAAGKIRKLGGKYKNIPIIALTANAVQGAKEMFLSNGFDGFISKPISIQEIIKILNEWLPPEKIEIREEKEIEENNEEKRDSEFLSELNQIEEIDVEIGLRRVSGMENMYRETIEFFNRKLVPDCINMYDKINYGDISGFAISIHAMKTALSTIGAMSLSETALKLETAAKDNDFEFCVQRFPVFRNKLLKLHNDLSAALQNNVETVKDKKAGDKAYLKEQVEKALKAVSVFDSDAGLNAINDLLVYDFGEQNNALLEDAVSAFNDFNYDSVTELLNKLKANQVTNNKAG
jgi:signal transduction histidine kinase/DNA-binding NarL/FixJ family response regulator/HPt (histidine-containing phosphotransfer) domain-containing protein